MLYKANIQFNFAGALELNAADEHEARVVLAQLESSVMDEITNWPTTELNRLEVCSQLLNLEAH